MRGEMKMSKWILTDDANFQCVREINEHTFECLEICQYHPDAEVYKVKRDIVDINDYSETELYDLLQMYSSDGYEPDNQIIAECIFETICEVDDWSFPHESYKDAICEVELITGLDLSSYII